MSRTPSIAAIRDNSFGYGLLPSCIFWWVCGPLWKLEEDYTFTLAVPLCLTDCKPQRFTIPAGYLFDKASVPPLFWIPPLGYVPDGLCTIPALEHDFLCDLLNGGSEWLRGTMGELPKCPPAWMVHDHFRRRLHAYGVKWKKAEAMGRAVMAFGPQGWGWMWLKGALWVAIALTIYLTILFYASH